MKLDDLIKNNQQFFDDRSLGFVLSTISSTSDVEVPEPILTTIHKLQHGYSLDADEFKCFNELMEQQNQETKNAVALLVFSLSSNIIKTYQHEITQANNDLDNSKFQDNKQNSIDSQYVPLLTSYILTNACLKHTSSGCKYYIQDNFVKLSSAVINEIPLTINLFRLTGHLPKHLKYCGLDTDKPLYPLNLGFERDNIKSQGIKNANDYWPYQNVAKQVQGGIKSTTLKATNYQRFVFFRGNLADNRIGVLASKLASLISKEHFAAEFILENRYSASKKHVNYVTPLSNEDAFKMVDQIIKKNGHFPGLGVIDEVLKFVGEGDENRENFAISNLNKERCFLTKIDFDMCSFRNSKEDCLSAFFKNPTIKDDNHYKLERATACMKIACIPDLLLNALAEKSGFSSDNSQQLIQIIKDKQSIHLQNMSDIRLNVYEEDDDFINQLAKVYIELKTHINTHQFSNKFNNASLNEALDKRLEFVVKKVFGNKAYTEVLEQLKNIIAKEEQPDFLPNNNAKG